MLVHADLLITRAVAAFRAYCRVFHLISLSFQPAILEAIALIRSTIACPNPDTKNNISKNTPDRHPAPEEW
jgi:hypothetical protein